jgi:hypothetical protein
LNWLFPDSPLAPVVDHEEEGRRARRALAALEKKGKADDC